MVVVKLQYIYIYTYSSKKSLISTWLCTQMHIDTLHRSSMPKICPAAPEIASCGRPASPHRWWQERHSLRGFIDRSLNSNWWIYHINLNLSIIFYLSMHISSYIHLPIQCSLIESTSFLPWSPVWAFWAPGPVARSWPRENSPMNVNIGDEHRSPIGTKGDKNQPKCQLKDVKETLRWTWCPIYGWKWLEMMISLEPWDLSSQNGCYFTNQHGYSLGL